MSIGACEEACEEARAEAREEQRKEARQDPRTDLSEDLSEDLSQERPEARRTGYYVSLDDVLLRLSSASATARKARPPAWLLKRGLAHPSD